MSLPFGLVRMYSNHWQIPGLSSKRPTIAPTFMWVYNLPKNNLLFPLHLTIWQKFPHRVHERKRRNEDESDFCFVDIMRTHYINNSCRYYTPVVFHIVNASHWLDQAHLTGVRAKRAPERNGAPPEVDKLLHDRVQTDRFVFSAARFPIESDWTNIVRRASKRYRFLFAAPKALVYILRYF